MSTTLRGTVIAEPNSYPCDATISAWRLEASRPETDLPLASVRTDASGAFELDLSDLGHAQDFLVRVHHGLWQPGTTQGRQLAWVEQMTVLQAEDTAQYPHYFMVASPTDDTRRLFLHVRTETGGWPGPEVFVYDPATREYLGAPSVEYGGWCQALLPGRSGSITLRFWAGGDTDLTVCERSFAEDDVETELILTPAGKFQVTGQVRRSPDDTSVAGVRVELLDRSGNWPRAVVTSQVTDQSGSFALSFGQILATPPDPTFAIWLGGARLALIDWPAEWRDGHLDDVKLSIDVAPDQPLTYELSGQVLARYLRAGVPDLDIVIWNQNPSQIERITTTDGSGRFYATLRGPASSGAPSIEIVVRHSSGSVLATHGVSPSAWVDGATTVFIEVDPPPRDTVSYRIAGRLLHSVTRAGIGGLRVEAWDKTPRTGGTIGAATHTADDGTFDLALAPRPTDSVPPDLYFRLYAGETAVPLPEPSVSWDNAGLGTTVIEIAGTPDSTHDEVVLHELGETIATAVNRMQNELARYPSELGAYVVDELDLSVPVAVQLDQLGQVRARVVDRAPADEQLGRFRMRVRPVMGVQAAPSEQLDQPLSTLSELGNDAIAALMAVRIYSVEDLARQAQTAAGREAIEALHLGIDMDKLLGKVALLALRVLPRPVRAALIRIGISNVSAFVDTDASELAEQLTAELDQTITITAVEAWQARAADLLRIPLPESRTDNQNGP
jgi:hypothetical protein